MLPWINKRQIYNSKKEKFLPGGTDLRDGGEFLA